MITGAIFDLDGTLLDSNGYWDRAPDAYLRTLGKKAGSELAKTIFTMTLPEAAAYMTREYGLHQSGEEIMAGINRAMERFYLTEVPLKEGAREALDFLQHLGIPMAVASVTDRPLVEAALTRFGLLGYFRTIVTTADVGVGKQAPDVYLRAAETLGSPPGKTLVFEDALHALETARRAGFRTAGVYDPASESCQERIRSVSDLYLSSLTELIPLLQEMKN